MSHSLHRMEQYDNLELICSSLSSLIFLLFSNPLTGDSLGPQSKLTSKKSKYIGSVSPGCILSAITIFVLGSAQFVSEQTAYY